MPCLVPNPLNQLSDAEITRLQRWAPLFDIFIEEVREDKWRFRVLYREGWSSFEVPALVGPTRLVSEICSKTIRWVYYQPCKSASQVFLSLSDQKIERFGELYVRWKESGFPEK